jgi:hypothetical protein
MKNKLFLSLTLISCTFWIQASFQLTSPTLKAADSLGMFDRSILDILQVRQKIKELIIGKFICRGAWLNLTMVDENNNVLPHTLNLMTKRPEALFGATFVIINPGHQQLFQFVSAEKQPAVIAFVQKAQHRHMLDRYENPDYSLIATGSFAQHPITKTLLPVFVADYTLEGYDTRITHAHLAIPAHDLKDFQVAQDNKLAIKLVISSPELDKASSPQFNKTTKELTAAYPGGYSDCIVINSDFLNGSIRHATEKAIAFLHEHNLGCEYKEPLMYSFANKQCSINDLQALETVLFQEHKSLSESQQEHLLILMLQAQSDLLSIVEQFLVNAREAKSLMIELIEESCALRKNNDAYLLIWAKSNSNESEKVIFKRDIRSFYSMCKFCAELIDFLGDFGSSCTHALENLKKIKNNK